MKIKKFFSFVCCLFLAVSCFASCALAYDTPIPNGRHVCFWNSGGVALFTGHCSGAVAHGFRNMSTSFTACLGGNTYVLLAEGGSNALDQKWENSEVWLHPRHGGQNQL